MNDQYTEEIRQIRDRQYEEMKNLTPEQSRAYTKEKTAAIEKRIAEIRNRKNLENMQSKDNVETRT